MYVVMQMNSGDVQLIDVREEDEIAVTGPYETSAKGSAVDFPGEVVASALTLPLSALQLGALHMQDKVFEEAFGFKKPSMEQHLAFACRSGVRSNKACNIALGAGYEKVYNYKGSALEWFGDKAK
jgi:rhodanese-related sulfurtransferase